MLSGSPWAENSTRSATPAGSASRASRSARRSIAAVAATKPGSSYQQQSVVTGATSPAFAAASRQSSSELPVVVVENCG